MSEVFSAMKDRFLPIEAPFKVLLLILLAWGGLAIANAVVYYLGLPVSTSWTFPISILTLRLSPSALLISGAWLIGFGLFFLLAMYRKWYETFTAVIGAGAVLIILGNLIQGGVQSAFYDPISLGDIQYYHDAIKINDWQHWLGNFNQLQGQLNDHSRTHPPGTVLLHYALLDGHSEHFIAWFFGFIGLLSLPLIYQIFLTISDDKGFAGKVTILYSVLPAANIYTLMSIDAVVVTCLNLALLGVVQLVKTNNRFSLHSYLFIFVGLSVGSSLTFGTLHMWAVLFCFAIYMFKFYGNRQILGAFLASGFGYLALVLLLIPVFGFNYFEAFFSASRLENPNGMLLLANPLGYFATRIENISEILLFLSLWGAYEIVTRLNLKTAKDPYVALTNTAIWVLLAMFLTGAYRTGETARACLFMLPYLLFTLRNVSPKLLLSLTSFAALQTGAMQLLGSYFW